MGFALQDRFPSMAAKGILAEKNIIFGFDAGLGVQ